MSNTFKILPKLKIITKKKMIFINVILLFTEPPDKPEQIIVDVIGNDSVKVSCIEADNPESAICTKFNREFFIYDLMTLDLKSNFE